MTTVLDLPPSPATHEVRNQPPLLVDGNLFESDRVLRDLVAREGQRRSDKTEREARRLGETLGSAEVLHLGDLANRFPPELHTHDRFGHRVDEVEYHPAYHELMRLGIEAAIHALPWVEPGPGAHVARAVKHYLLTQVEAGVLCPMTMTFAVVPSLRREPTVAAEWEERVTSYVYDPRSLPPDEKLGCTMGMAMTEKQGGSDVRANTTRACPLGNGGRGEAYLLTGHKWFCSAPMSDAFLTLAQSENGLSCFLVPRWLENGKRNRFYVQRLKNKLGNRSNASSEIEYHDTWAQLVGAEGQGVKTIIEMVNHTRLDCLIGSAGLMRQAVAQALHHAAHREAFGRRLVEQPLMKNVLADLALESEAATVLMGRVARAYDNAMDDPAAEPLRRLLTAVSKYWVTKRAPGVVAEALECHGGNGYVEESILPRLYRESPLSSIWEGSGNVMCLDVLRALAREPEVVGLFLAELGRVQGDDPRFDRHLAAVKASLEAGTEDPERLQAGARRLVEGLALAVQGALLLEHAPPFVAEAFCAARLGGEGGKEYGTLPADAEFDKIIERAMPR